VVPYRFCHALDPVSPFLHVTEAKNGKLVFFHRHEC
jgi:hypothetical protein